MPTRNNTTTIIKQDKPHRPPQRCGIVSYIPQRSNPKIQWILETNRKSVHLFLANRNHIHRIVGSRPVATATLCDTPYIRPLCHIPPAVATGRDPTSTRIHRPCNATVLGAMVLAYPRMQRQRGAGGIHKKQGRYALGITSFLFRKCSAGSHRRRLTAGDISRRVRGRRHTSQRGLR